MASDRFLVVCETFFSIQGEGATIGKPAVFLRLSGCNLRCRGFSYRDPNTQAHLGCDTAQVWTQGKQYLFSALLDAWKASGWLEKLKQGAHLVVTGGEPLLQQPALVNFISLLDSTLKSPPYIELETNATLKLCEELFQRINQFNVSPKLSHSGESRAKAYHPELLLRFARSEKAYFKFVIASPCDVEEVITEFQRKFELCPSQIWLMPEGGTAAAINEKKTWLIECAKQHCFSFTTRLHIDVWGEVVGV